MSPPCRRVRPLKAAYAVYPRTAAEGVVYAFSGAKSAPSGAGGLPGRSGPVSARGGGADRAHRERLASPLGALAGLAGCALRGLAHRAARVAACALALGGGGCRGLAVRRRV